MTVAEIRNYLQTKCISINIFHSLQAAQSGIHRLANTDSLLSKTGTYVRIWQEQKPEAAFGILVAVLHIWEVLRAASILYVRALVLPTDKSSQVEFVVLNSLEKSPKEKTWFRQQAKLCHTLLSEFMTLFKGAILRLAVSLYQNFECNHKTIS